MNAFRIALAAAALTVGFTALAPVHAGGERVPAPRPTLRMPDLRVGPYFRALEGASRPRGVPVEATVMNTGNGAAGRFVVTAFVYIRGATGPEYFYGSFTRTVESLAAGTSRGIVFRDPLTFPRGTSVTIQYHADFVPETGNDFAPRGRGAVREWNEGNNMWSTSVTVR
jgi:hypothetical protein